jgi:hypothetical protein
MNKEAKGRNGRKRSIGILGYLLGVHAWLAFNLHAWISNTPHAHDTAFFVFFLPDVIRTINAIKCHQKKAVVHHYSKRLILRRLHAFMPSN